MSTSRATASAVPHGGARKPAVTTEPSASGGFACERTIGPGIAVTVVRAFARGLPVGRPWKAEAIWSATTSDSTSPSTTTVTFSATKFSP